MPKSLNILNSWINETIIGLNLCPFAKESLTKLHVEKSLLSDTEALTKTILDISEGIFKENYSNAIVYFEEAINFKSFYELSLEYEEVLNATGYKIKVIAFHPNFVFEGLNIDAKANFVNRSPMPLLHLIPMDLIVKARLSNDQAKNISINNEQKIEKLNKEEINKYFSYMDNK